MKSHLIAAAVLATGISSSAFAAPIFSESFDSLTTGALPGQNSWTAGNPTVVEPGLAYSNTAGPYTYTNANAAKGGRTGTTANTYSTNTSLNLTQQTTYFSFLVNAGNNAATVENQPVRLFTSTSSGAGLGVRLNAGPTGDVAMTANIGTGVSGTANSSSLTSTSVTSGVTHLIVGKIEFDVSGVNDRISLWAFDSDDVMDAAAFATGEVVFEAASVIGSQRTTPIANSIAVGRTNNSTYQISLDEIRIGTELGDVISIPEPATLGLLGLGGLALGRRRRNV